MFKVILFLSLVTLCLTQATFDSIRLCARPCSDGSTFTACVDTFGAISSGDCTSPGLFPNCPSPLSNVGRVYDLHQTEQSKPYWRTVGECNQYRQKLKTATNVPVIISGNQTSLRNYNPLYFLLDKHKNFDHYSKSELSQLASLIHGTLPATKRSSFREHEMEILRSVHGFAHFVWVAQNTKGIYTNGKCAACSIMIQGILNKVTSKACDSIVSTFQTTLCLPTTKFKAFCEIFVEQAGLLTGATETITTMCSSAIKNFATSTNFVKSADELCSQLTCTAPQQIVINSTSQITGTCSIVSGTSLNERCSQFLTVLSAAERGICILENSLVIYDAVKSPEKATVNSLASLAVGKTPPVAEAVQKLAKGCSGSDVSESSNISVHSGFLLFSFLLFIVIL